MQLLQSGMKDAGDSHDIERWQQFLIGHGFNPGPADGDFGDNTRDATIAFQKAKWDRADARDRGK
jgi:peptidoglycan hydrolase-like protein with peptidoglycan-binding domain